MMIDYQIRQATPSDLHALLELENLCFTQDKMSRESYRSLLKKKTAGIWLIEIAKNIVASAVIFYRKNSTIARLYSLAVNPNYRKLGLAEALLKIIEKTILRHTCETLILEVRLDNKAAIKFYEKHGFEIFGTYEKFYEDGTNALRMRKIIEKKYLIKKIK